MFAPRFVVMAQFQQAPRFGSRERWIAIAILYAGLIIYILYGGDNVEDDTLRDYDDDELLHSTDNKITPDKQQENSVRSAPKLPPLESLVQRTDAVSEKLEHLKQEIESGNCSGCTRREEQVVCGGIEAGWTKTKFCGVLKTVADNQLCPESGHGNLEYHTTW